MEIYRGTRAGVALVTSLNTLLREGAITREQATKILETFDDTFLVEAVKVSQKESSKPEVEGVIETYNYVDNKWRIEISDVVLNTGGGELFKLDRASLLLQAEPGLTKPKSHRPK